MLDETRLGLRLSAIGGPSTMETVSPDLDPGRRAIQAYQAIGESGAPLSERKLAEQFEKSHQWERKIIA